MNAYEQAVREVTPLQRRILDAMSAEPLTEDELAKRARLFRQTGKSGGRRMRLDTNSTRNGLIFLAAKGRVIREADGRWRRLDAGRSRTRRRSSHHRRSFPVRSETLA